MVPCLRAASGCGQGRGGLGGHGTGSLPGCRFAPDSKCVDWSGGFNGGEILEGSWLFWEGHKRTAPQSGLQEPLKTGGWRVLRGPKVKVKQTKARASDIPEFHLVLNCRCEWPAGEGCQSRVSWRQVRVESIVLGTEVSNSSFKSHYTIEWPPWGSPAWSMFAVSTVKRVQPHPECAAAAAAAQCQESKAQRASRGSWQVDVSPYCLAGV